MNALKKVVRWQVLLALILTLVFAAFSVKPLLKAIITDELSARNVAVSALIVEPWTGRIELHNAQRISPRGELYAESVQIRFSWQILWSDDWSDLELDLVGARARLRIGQLETDTPETTLARRRDVASILPKLEGVQLHWDGLRVTIEHTSGTCKVTLGAASIGVDEPPASTEVLCEGLGKTLHTHATTDLRSIATGVVIRPTAPLELSGLPLDVSYEEATLNIFESPILLVKGVDIKVPNLSARIELLRLGSPKLPVHVVAIGGEVRVERSQAPQQDLVTNSDTESAPDTAVASPSKETFKLPQFDLPKFLFEWSGTTVHVDEKQIGHLTQLAVDNQGIRGEIQRGDSYLFVKANLNLPKWRETSLEVSGVLHLADVDGIWPSDAMIDGQVGLDGSYEISTKRGHIALNAPSIRVLHPSLAMMPFHLPEINAQVQFSNQFGLSRGVMQGNVKIGELETRFRLALAELGKRFQFRWWGKPVPCTTLLSTVPPEWLSEMSFGLKGDAEPLMFMGGRLDVPETLRFKFKGVVEKCRVTHVKVPWESAGIKVYNATERAWEIPEESADVSVLNRSFIKRVHPSYSKGAVVNVGPGSGVYWPLSGMPSYVSGVMYLSEEASFFRNPGVDVGLIQRAIRLDLSHGRYVYGGSTVTQQLVKNLLLDRRKTLRRKFYEMLLADHIFQRVSKRRVLELYLNVIEFGPRIFGIGRAASYYFQKAPSMLSVPEAIFLAMLKPSPSIGPLFVMRGQTPPYPYWDERAVQLLERLVRYGHVTSEAAAEIDSLKLHWRGGIAFRPAPKEPTPDEDDSSSEATEKSTSE